WRWRQQTRLFRLCRGIWLPAADRARQGIDRRNQLVAALVSLSGLLGAHLPDDGGDADVAGDDLRQIRQRRLHLPQHHVDLDVRRLDVAVDDVVGVRPAQSFRALSDDGNDLRWLEGGLPEHGIERAAVEVLHDDVRIDGVLVAAHDLVDLDDRRVGNPREDLRLAAEALHVAGIAVREDLDCDVAVQRGIERAIDRTHSPRTEHDRVLVAAERWRRRRLGHQTLIAEGAPASGFRTM